MRGGEGRDWTVMELVVSLRRLAPTTPRRICLYSRQGSAVRDKKSFWGGGAAKLLFMFPFGKKYNQKKVIDQHFVHHIIITVIIIKKLGIDLTNRIGQKSGIEINKEITMVAVIILC